MLLKKNIPMADSVSELIELIKENNDWVNPVEGNIKKESI